MKIKDEVIIEMMSQKRSQEKGLRAMMDAYQSRLYWHIRRLVVSHEVAQDVLQETFIKAYQKFHQFIRIVNYSLGCIGLQQMKHFSNSIK